MRAATGTAASNEAAKQQVRGAIVALHLREEGEEGPVIVAEMRNNKAARCELRQNGSDPEKRETDAQLALNG